MIEIEAGGSIGDVEADALAVPVTADRTHGPGADWVESQLGDWLSTYLDLREFSGKRGELVEIPGSGRVPYRSVYLVGLGTDPSSDDVRAAAGALGRSARGATTVATTLHLLDGPATAAATAAGFVMGQYRFEKHKSEQKPNKTERVIFLEADDAAVAAANRAAVLAAAVNLARDLVNEPPAHKSAETLADLAVSIGDETGMRVVVYDEPQLREGGFGGVLGVNAGAHNPPRLVEMWHEPEGATAFVAFVGKGIIFDSGGLSLKPAASMEDMKTDMSGAAAVIAAMKAVAELQLPVKVLGIAPMTENMPGGGATRPGDVLTARNGKTIEVLNTDAEGRLVLADGLSLAAEHSPDLIIDIATLTGTCKAALGEHIAGLFSDDDGAAEKVLAAAGRAGERIWRMPLPPDYRKKMDSDVADIKNSGPRWGGAITAASFLKEFVGDHPWVHLDIAGPARADSTEGHIVKGGTGFGVLTLVALAEDMGG